MSKKWYRIQAKADSADIYIYDYIGMWGVEAGDFTKDLSTIQSKAKINLYINSPGGNVFDGMAIYNALLSVKSKLTVHVMGLAASMASVIMLAGDTRIVYQGAMVMIHNPWGGVSGTASEMRETADLLDKITEQIVNLYVNATGQSEDQIRDWMNAETWFSAEESIEHNFSTELSEQEAAASIKNTYAKKYHNVPSDIVEQDTEPTIRTAEDALRDAGFSNVRAKAILAKGFTHRDDEEPHRDDDLDYSEALAIVDELKKELEGK